MTQPAQAKKRSSYDAPRTYAWPPLPPHEFEVISVTSVTDNWPKPWLTGWAVKMTAECATDEYEYLGKVLSGEIVMLDARGREMEPVDAARSWLKKARFRSSGVKADRGTVVHAAVESYLAGKPLTADQLKEMLAERRVPNSLWKSTAGMVAGVMEFLFEVEPEILWSESTVYSRTHGYAGTPDIIAKMQVGGSIQPAIVDIKTSKDIYDDVCFQLTGYGHADFVGLNDGTEAELVPGLEGPIQHGVVIRPTASGRYARGDFSLSPDVFDAFLAMLHIANAQANEVPRRSRRS